MLLWRPARSFPRSAAPAPRASSPRPRRSPPGDLRWPSLAGKAGQGIGIWLKKMGCDEWDFHGKNVIFGDLNGFEGDFNGILSGYECNFNGN